MSDVDSLLEPILHSPKLPELLALLKDKYKEEQAKRAQFYQDITPEQKVEFIEGEVILHSPARNRHLDVTKFISNLLSNFVEVHQLGSVKVEKCLVVFPRNDYEPDVVFFDKAKEASLQDDTMKFPVPDLVVEVLSPSTEFRDRGVKFEDFAANGVGEYWIVDAEASTIEQYLLDDEGYALKLKSSSGQIVSPVISGFCVEIEALFDRDKNLQALKRLMAEGLSK